jgi:hypothetical protein
MEPYEQSTKLSEAMRTLGRDSATSHEWAVAIEKLEAALKQAEVDFEDYKRDAMSVYNAEQKRACDAEADRDAAKAELYKCAHALVGSEESLMNAVILLHHDQLHAGHCVGPSSECAKCKAYLSGEL